MKISKVFIVALVFLVCITGVIPCFAESTLETAAATGQLRYSDIRVIVGDFTAYRGIADFKTILIPNPSSAMDSVRFRAELKDAAGGVHQTWTGTVMIDENGVFIMEGTEELWLAGDYHVSIVGDCYAGSTYLESFTWVSQVSTY